jgi:3-oxoadipate enol-lactonase
MPHVNVNGTELYYEQSGDGPETIVFAHGVLLSGRMFDGEVAAFKDHYRCVTFDHRGQGKSAVPPAGYDMDSLAAETAALLRVLDCAPCHFVGFSMGGFIAMRLAVEHPELLRSLILMGTSASREPRALSFRLLCCLAWCLGSRIATPWVMPIQFSPKFLNDPKRRAERDLWHERMATNHRLGSIRAAGGVINRPDYSEPLCRIRTPTLILAGAADRAAPPAEQEKLHRLIAGSELALIPDAGHAVAIEEPAAVNAILGRFLKKMQTTDCTDHTDGKKTPPILPSV